MHEPRARQLNNALQLSPRSSGPLPKSDSVQSLVSLVNRSTTSSGSNDELTIKGVDANSITQTVMLTPETEFISLSGLGLSTLSLTALSSAVAAPSIREISLAANDLEVVDLSPLIACPSLAVLSLNSNRIASIDLSPLSTCTKLERLWLHDNCLESIDLSPIATCKSLRSLYLEDNSLHESSVDLSPLALTSNLRSLRLSGNRLGGKLDLTALLLCPGLSVFNVDSSVTLVSDGTSSQARLCPAMRRIVLNVKFTGRPIENLEAPRPRSTPPKPPSSQPRPRRRITPPKLHSPLPYEKKVQGKPAKVVKVVLVGFRRHARYAAEDSLTRCGKVMIRAAGQDVASTDPGLLLDSHLIILYAPSEKTLRQVSVVVGRIPTVVLGSERYRSRSEGKTSEILKDMRFFVDPLSPEDTINVYNLGHNYVNGNQNLQHKAVQPSTSTASDSSPVSEEGENSHGSKTSIQRSFSEPSLLDSYGPVNIELEDIEDEGQYSDSSKNMEATTIVRRSKSADGITLKEHTSSKLNTVPSATWSEVNRRLKERKVRKSGRGWGSYAFGEMSLHGRNKLRAEQAAVEVAFSDLSGYATAESCSSVARACGLPKCAGPILFRAAYGSSFEIESTTPEAGVPNTPMERKNRRISVESFMVYWNSRLKAFTGEERLSNVLEDNHSALSSDGDYPGHSKFGAPLPGKALSAGCLPSIDRFEYSLYKQSRRGRGMQGSVMNPSISMSNLPTDMSCPCDAGIEMLISRFMEGRSSRFGSFALVKMSEAIAIGSSLVIYGLRGTSKNRVGGHARPVCPKEVREGKLNAALIAAEAGIFEGVACGLSMDQIRSVKGCFATEASPESVSRHSGLAISYTLTLAEVQRFCVSRKTLLPGAVERTFAVHCKHRTEMRLGEFAVLLSVMSNISSHGALEYFFSVVDVDQDDRWTLPDLRHFHMEKEKIWLSDGMAVSELGDIWVNMLDMIQPCDPRKGISRRDLRKLSGKDRKLVIQSLLFADDDHSVLNIRRTIELNQNATSPLVM